MQKQSKVVNIRKLIKNRREMTRKFRSFFEPYRSQITGSRRYFQARWLCEHSSATVLQLSTSFV